MIQAGIRGVMRQGYKPTTVRNKRDRPAPDLVNRAFHAEAPDLLWVADITEIPTRSGKLYLATVLDVFSRRIVGFAMDTHMESTLTQRALQETLTARKPSQTSTTPTKAASTPPRPFVSSPPPPTFRSPWARWVTATTTRWRRASLPPSSTSCCG